MEKVKDIMHLNIGKFIEEWNSRHPYDRWWRKKYNIPFGSKQHREASFIEMAIEYKEDLYFQKLANKEAEIDEIEREVDRMIAGDANTQKSAVKVVKMTKKELDTEFDNLDLSQFNG